MSQKSSPTRASSAICCTTPALGEARSKRSDPSSRRRRAATSGGERSGTFGLDSYCSSDKCAILTVRSNVQVTLQILKAMIDKSPRDLPLFAPYVLRILTAVLKSKDIGMVEDSVPTFQTFCEHQDLATLTADQELVKQYEEIVGSYATFVSKPPSASKSPMSTPIAIRWKTAGLKAIKSISSSEAIGTDGGRQLSKIVPVILENLYSSGDEALASLHQKIGSEKDASMKRRMSVNTVRTTDHGPDTSNVPVSESTAEADRLAEEGAALLALQSLNQIFSANNRVQIRLAFAELLKFFMRKSLFARPETATSTKSTPTGSWPTALTEMVTRWSPVQDRFIIVVTAMEALVRSPTVEENMSNQLVVGRLIQWLLGSTINMIGLSVMDILLSLIQHVLILLQLGGKGTNILPHHQQTGAIDLFKESPLLGSPSTGDTAAQKQEEKASTPSAARQELLDCLQKCIANLAAHIYYGDQISDILTAILLRLKPSPTSGLATAAAAIEKPAAAAQAISESANIKEDPSTNEFFSFGTARVTALNAVKDVLLIANKRGATAGAGAVGRNKVGVRVWEGTQWLLRDEDRRVRRAYVDALLTWMQLELNKKDLRIIEEKSKSKKPKQLGDDEPKRTGSVARVASNASRGSRARPLKTTFMQLLHLAVYDNALEAPENDSDVLLMNLLLTSLVERLGVNALQSGLPVMVRLQEDINIFFKTPKAKVNVGSLVHGYFLCLSKVFEFDTTLPGYEIQSEISRRQKAGLWMERLQFPSLALDHLIVSSSPESSLLPERTAQNESLKPFDNIASMVNQISIAYSNSVSSPPSSPPQSPSRGVGSPIKPIGLRMTADELPTAFREILLSKWTKEACLASIEKDSARTISPHGSRSGTTHSNGLLAANGHQSRDASPAAAVLEAQGTGKKVHSPLGIQTSQIRRASAQGSGPPTPVSNADHTQTVRVDDLKRVLAGGSLADALHSHKSAPRNGSPLRNSSTAYQDFGNDTRQLDRTATRPSIISTGSESAVEAEGFESASEGDPEHPLPTPQTPVTSKELTEQYMQQLGRRSYEQQDGSSGRARPDSHDTNRPPSRMSRPRSSSSASAEDPEANAKALKGELVPSVVRGSIVGDEGVPPVPPLPQGIVNKIPQSPQLQTAIAAKINPTLADYKAISPTSLDGGAVGSTPLGPQPTNNNLNINNNSTNINNPSTQAAGTAPPPAVTTASNPPTARSSRERDRSVGRSSVGNRSSAGNRSSLKASAAAATTAGDRRTMMQALLGSIEVRVDGAGAGGPAGVGRPPY